MKQLAALKKTTDFFERLAIVKDEHPRSEFDKVFMLAEDARFFASMVKLPADRRARLEAIGQWLAEAIETGNSQILHDLAAALNKRKRHKPKRDPIRATLVALDGMFPERRGKLAVRDVMRSLKRKRFRIDENTPRTIRRAAAQLGIPLRGIAGRPPKKIGTKPR